MSSRTRNSGAALKERLSKGLLIAPGIHDGVSARQAVQAGAEAVYMTGFGVAGSLLGVPDIGLVSATEMTERVRALAAASSPVPLIADGDNGHGGTANVERLVRAYEQAGAAAIQLEDQVLPKRCGHLDGKEIVSREEAVAKIKAAVGARDAGTFLVIARTDARSVKGMDEALW
ncbi:MAG: oxaloacetate decarboxylase, partial [Alphaproteobacteria bacterium]